jgi:hypothetical protein
VMPSSLLRWSSPETSSQVVCLLII